SAVVGPHNFHRHSRNRNAQIRERKTEVADLEILLNYHADFYARDLTVFISRRQTNVEQTVEHHGRIESAQVSGCRAVPTPKLRPHTIVWIVVAAETVFENPCA